MKSSVANFDSTFFYYLSRTKKAALYAASFAIAVLLLDEFHGISYGITVCRSRYLDVVIGGI